jgi:uncharacterized lipoprotein
MKKLIAVFGILALAACGGDAESGAATTEDTVAVPATEVAPVVPADTTMAPVTDTMAAPMTDTAAPMTDSAAG